MADEATTARTAPHAPAEHRPGEQISAARLTEIRALRLPPGVGRHLGTDAERELYRLSLQFWNGLQDLLLDHAHLTAASTVTAEELARWRGDVQ
ncbi:hypothetical protein ABTZ78_17075 [Streptomyces bauhiniae]|uniref:hypothetical protein n=1 Tax=Streptomyces bauhiniae TaxID=2340725 RepID=UPI0033206D7D